MEIIKGDDFRRSLKKGLSGGYFFFGDEDYLKHSYAKEVKKLILDGSFDSRLSLNLFLPLSITI